MKFYLKQWLYHRGNRCDDCRKNVHRLGNYMVLRAAIWLKVKPDAEQKYPGRSNGYSYNGMLCLKCIERRLGRQLRHDDFAALPINTILDAPKRECFYKSPELLARLQDFDDSYLESAFELERT